MKSSKFQLANIKYFIHHFQFTAVIVCLFFYSDGGTKCWTKVVLKWEKSRFLVLAENISNSVLCMILFFIHLCFFFLYFSLSWRICPALFFVFVFTFHLSFPLAKVQNKAKMMIKKKKVCTDVDFFFSSSSDNGSDARMMRISSPAQGETKRRPYHEFFWEHLISLRERKRKTEMARGVWGEDVYVKESVVGTEAEFKGSTLERWMRYLWVNAGKYDFIHIRDQFLVSPSFHCHCFKCNYSVRWRGNCSDCEILLSQSWNRQSVVVTDWGEHRRTNSLWKECNNLIRSDGNSFGSVACSRKVQQIQNLQTPHQVLLRNYADECGGRWSVKQQQQNKIHKAESTSVAQVRSGLWLVESLSVRGSAAECNLCENGQCSHHTLAKWSCIQTEMGDTGAHPATSVKHG